MSVDGILNILDRVLAARSAFILFVGSIASLGSTMYIAPKIEFPSEDVRVWGVGAIVVCSFAFGALAANGIVFLAGHFYSGLKTRRAEKTRVEKLTSRLESVFAMLPPKQVDCLRELTEGPCRLNWNLSAVQALRDADWIEFVHKADTHSGFFQLQPDVKDRVKELLLARDQLGPQSN